MSVVANYIGSLDYPRYYVFSGTGTPDVYTVGAKQRSLTLGAFSFANDTGSAIQCRLYHYDGTTEYLVWTGSAPANDTKIVESNPIRLRAGEIIRATADTGVTLKMSFIYQLETVPA